MLFRPELSPAVSILVIFVKSSETLLKAPLYVLRMNECGIDVIYGLSMRIDSTVSLLLNALFAIEVTLYVTPSYSTVSGMRTTVVVEVALSFETSAVGVSPFFSV